jgi:hypothetical protein
MVNYKRQNQEFVLKGRARHGSVREGFGPFGHSTHFQPVTVIKICKTGGYRAIRIGFLLSGRSGCSDQVGDDENGSTIPDTRPGEQKPASSGEDPTWMTPELEATRRRRASMLPLEVLASCAIGGTVNSIVRREPPCGWRAKLKGWELCQGERR